MIELDGSHLEGGGALVRVALALSTLTGKEFKVKNIRARREHSGLKMQHLVAIKALKEICDAETNEVELGSTELWFKPRTIKKGNYTFDIGTAGSITLLLQALILPCLFAPGKVTITVSGGTCGKWQASVDYLQNILLPHLKRFAEKINLKIMKRGYYPKGGGEIILEISPRIILKDFNDFQQFLTELSLKVPLIQLIKQGKLEQIKGVINVSSELENKQVGERIKNAVEGGLKNLIVPADIRVEYAQSLSIGGEALIWAVSSTDGEINLNNPLFLSSDVLIEKEKNSEEIGKEAAEKLNKGISSGTIIDEHLVDQLIPFMSLLPGSEIKAGKISKHAKTNIYVAEAFLNVNFKIDGTIIKAESQVAQNIYK